MRYLQKSCSFHYIKHTITFIDRLSINWLDLTVQYILYRVYAVSNNSNVMLCNTILVPVMAQVHDFITRTPQLIAPKRTWQTNIQVLSKNHFRNQQGNLRNKRKSVTFSQLSSSNSKPIQIISAHTLLQE